MKSLIVMAALSVAPNHTPVHPKIERAMCVAVQVCQQCQSGAGGMYPCNCHMECLPGTESRSDE